MPRRGLMGGRQRVPASLTSPVASRPLSRTRRGNGSDQKALWHVFILLEILDDSRGTTLDAR